MIFQSITIFANEILVTQHFSNFHIVFLKIALTYVCEINVCKFMHCLMFRPCRRNYSVNLQRVISNQNKPPSQ